MKIGIGSVLLGLLLAFAPSAPAQAIRCSHWNRLGPEQRAQTIQRMIDSGLQGSTARRYDIDPGRVRACLERYAYSIERDFDSACSQGMSTDLQALNTLFKNYAWSCFQ